MKKIALLGFLCAAVIFTGCRRDDDTTAPEEGLVVTGSISEMPATKTGLDFDGTKLNQTWEIGDHIIGSFRSGNAIVDMDYEVISISGNVATFKKVGSFVDPSEGTTVYALCLGQNGSTHEKTNGGYFKGDIRNGYRTIMTATSTVSSGRLIFNFQNRATVIGSESVQIDGSQIVSELSVGNEITTSVKLSHSSENFTFYSDGAFEVSGQLENWTTRFYLFVPSKTTSTATLENFTWTVLPDEMQSTYLVVKDESHGYSKQYGTRYLGPGYFYSLGNIVFNGTSSELPSYEKENWDER